MANEAVVPYRTKLPRQKSGNSVRQQLQRSVTNTRVRAMETPGFPRDSRPARVRQYLQHAWCKESSSSLSVSANRGLRWCCGG